MERLTEFGFVASNPETLYRTLRQMENMDAFFRLHTADRNKLRKKTNNRA